MSGTHVYYNGVLFRDCETHEFASLVEFDESRVNVKFIRTRVTISSTLVSVYPDSGSQPLALSEQHSSTIAIPPVSDSTAPGRYEEILERLAEQRKDFWLAVNSATNNAPTSNPVSTTSAGGSSYRLQLIATGIQPTGTSDEYVKAFDANLSVKRVDVIDVNAGPKTMNCGIQDGLGGQVMRVYATFEICRVLSKTYPTDPDPVYDAQKCKGVINNVWKVTDAMGDDGAVSHTITGKITVKDHRYKANAMRLYSFPLAFPYARITDRRYTTSEDGLVLEYSYTMRHAGSAPPPGVRKYEARYTEIVRAGSHGIHEGRMNISVWGWYHRDINGSTPLTAEKIQKQMLMRGMQTILWTRIRGISKQWNPLPGQEAQRCNLIEAAISEQIGVPRLDMTVSVIWTDKNNTEYVNRIENLGEPIDWRPIGGDTNLYDPRWWPCDGPWGRLMVEDKDNPLFRNDVFPYKDEGTPENSNYFNGYYHSPGSNRHTLPRLAGKTSSDPFVVDKGKEWARAGGFVPGDATSTQEGAANSSDVNPISFSDTAVLMSRNLKGELVMGAVPAVQNDSFTGVSDIQSSGFSYIQWQSEILTDSKSGMITLPLSAPRQISLARVNALRDGGAAFQSKNGLVDTSGMTLSGAMEHCVSIRLHAPITKRAISGTATRIGKTPQIPDPVSVIVRCDVLEGSPGSPANAIAKCIETLESKEVLTQIPKLLGDGCSRSYEISFRYLYALSAPWGENLGGENDFGELPFGFDPTVKASAQNNTIVVRGQVWNDTLPDFNASPIFNESPTTYG